MLWTFLIISIIYYLFVVFLIRHWDRKTPLPAGRDVAEKPMVSVVVAVRDEEETIGCLMDSLTRQTYPGEKFEVIVMDDGSTDNTSEIVQVKGRNLSCELKMGVTGVDQLQGIGKKAAIAEGIERAVGELILVTDGDCRTDPQWISTMVKWYLNLKADFLAGPVRMKNGNGFWQQWQVLEFASLSGTGGAFIRSGNPLFCNGANMAFRKEIFQSLEGYEGNRDFASGDDVFLMQKIRASGGEVVYVKDEGAIVETRPVGSWRDFFHQRNRWAGKWHRYRSAWSIFVPLFIFVYYLTMLTALVFTVSGSFTWWVFMLLLAVKVVFDYVFLRKVMNFLNNKMNIGIFVLASVGYAVYAVFFGITANLAGYKWKGRKHAK